MPVSFSEVGALVGAIGGLLLAAAPALARTRKSQRIRARIKQDLELIDAAEKVKLEGDGLPKLREAAETEINDLLSHGMQLQQKSSRRRRRIGKFLEVGAIVLGIAIAIVCGLTFFFALSPAEE